MIGAQSMRMEPALLAASSVKPRMRDVASVLVLVVLTASAFVTLLAVPFPTQAASAATASLSDDFTHDTSLNASLWQVNGPVGSVLGPKDAGISLVTLEPAFSSKGMEISQVNDRQEVGTIQSIENFTPPFTLSATVEGTVSNGHTFGLAIASADAATGVLIYGNLNDTNCSNLINCGDPAVCGNSADPAVIPPNQCYYGIDGKVGLGGNWTGSKTTLYRTPSLNVTYTLRISVDASGNARYSISQGGQVQGSVGIAQVGTGPFYIVLEQAEGSPVGSGRANDAYWMSVSVAPIAITSTTSTSPGPGSSGIPVEVWIILGIVIVILLLILLLWYRRRRKFTVIVQDSWTHYPIAGAAVTAVGPKEYAGAADKKGRAIFSNPKEGNYTIQAKAPGYSDSVPALIKVEEDKTEHLVNLDRTARGEAGQGSAAPPGGPGPQPQPRAQVAQAAGPAAAPTPPGVPGGAAQSQALPEFEGWGGDRIRQIIATFQAKGAISPETALTAKELGLSRFFVRIMERRKGRTRVFVDINGRYYLDQEALREMTGQSGH